MSREAQVQSSMYIRKDNAGATGANAGMQQLQDYRSSPSLFIADVAMPHLSVRLGLDVPTTGILAAMPTLLIPGLYFVHHQGRSDGVLIANADKESYYVEWGIYEPANDRFYPKDELLPGEFFPGRFSRNLLQEYNNTGTGTSAATNLLWFKAHGATCRIGLDVFNK